MNGFIASHLSMQFHYGSPGLVPFNTTEVIALAMCTLALVVFLGLTMMLEFAKNSEDANR
jgi:hypothetical protein